jgi:hypothetical protein
MKLAMRAIIRNFTLLNIAQDCVVQVSYELVEKNFSLEKPILPFNTLLLFPQTSLFALIKFSLKQIKLFKN